MTIEQLIAALESPDCIWTSELDAQCGLQVRGAITVDQSEYGVFLARWIPWYAAPHNRAATLTMLREKQKEQRR